MSVWRRTQGNRYRRRLRRPRIKPVDAWRGSMYLSEAAVFYAGVALFQGRWWMGGGVLLVGLALRLYSAGYR